MRRHTVGALACLAAVASRLEAQFQMPLPAHLPGGVVLTTKGRVCSSLGESLRRFGLDTVPHQTAADSARGCRIIRHVIPSRLKARSDGPVSALFGGNALTALDQLGGGFSGSEAYVYSTLIAGNAGDFRFNVSYLRAASRVDSLPADSMGTRQLRQSSDRLTQIIMNGGEATARFLMPHRATGGINWQTSWGTYASVGLVGKVDERAPVPVAVSLVTEMQASLAIRKPDTYDLLGEIYLALRPGFSVVTGRQRIVEGLTERKLPFLQIAAGLRTGERLRYGIAYTLVRGMFRPFVPTFQIVAQTTLPTVAVKK